MAECEFSVPFKGVTAETLLRIAKKRVAEEGASLVGTSTSGRITADTPLGTVKGVYRVVGGNTLRVSITDKPFALPCFKLETELKKGLVAAIEEARLAPKPDPTPMEPLEVEDDEDEDEEVDMPVEPPPSPLDPSPEQEGPISSVVWTVKQLQQHLVAVGAKKDKRLTDGLWGPYTRSVALSAFTKLGHPDVRVVVINARKIAISPVSAARALKNAAERRQKLNPQPAPRFLRPVVVTPDDPVSERKNGRLIFVALAGIVAFGALAVLSGRQKGED
jgi:hypothetical protein